MARTKETEMIAWRQMYEEGLARADETSLTLYPRRIDETDVTERRGQSHDISAKVINASFKQTQYHNPFLDIEAIDDDNDKEVSDDAEMYQFIARDDEVDGTEGLRCIRSPAVMREHAKSTYLTDVIRRWDLESDGCTTEHGSFENSPPFVTRDYEASGLAASPLIGHATSIDESYIWKMKCQRHRGRYITANIFACSEYVPVVQVLVRSMIYVPSDPYCVYLEAHMTKALKTWLKTVPGVVVFNDSVDLTAVDYSDWHKVMTYMPKYREPNSFVGDQWRTIGYGTSMGRPVFVIGPSDDTQQPGYDVLMVPMLSLKGGAYDTYPVQSLEPMLFDATTMAIIHGVKNTNTLLRIFIKSKHPQIVQNINLAPRPRSWAFYSGEPVMIHHWMDRDSSRLFTNGKSRACIIVNVQDTYIEVDDIEGSGQFIVKEWHTIEKVFTVRKGSKLSTGPLFIPTVCDSQTLVHPTIHELQAQIYLTILHTILP
ncbi:hypothetical protein ARMGADRAFT_1022659 [Armillaria gallica]|uniref:FHA domain-containing protein n=1 Tax=Armillaria gallica TaxID=47427 RepID=A0A2H3E9U4_ARMGA|nr:hypothetical protein ARMGADRAFT_1022659 [Armillaria gallica]